MRFLCRNVEESDNANVECVVMFMNNADDLAGWLFFVGRVVVEGKRMRSFKRLIRARCTPDRQTDKPTWY